VPNEKLDTVFVMGDIVAGIEQGFMLPEAGMDWKWAAENWDEFNRRAREGDEGMKRLVEECKVREVGAL